MIALKDSKELQELLDKGVPLLLDFYADWCPPCRQLMPILELISGEEKYSKAIKFIKININTFPEIARQFEVASIPTLVFISGQADQPRETHVGFFEKDNLVFLIEKYFF